MADALEEEMTQAVAGEVTQKVANRGERRQSALAGLGWRTVANASARDAVLAEEQRSALEEFANGIEDLDDAIEHLGLGFFRGYSVCQPIWDGLSVRRIELLDSWNFLKGEHGELLWNPECSMDPSRCEEITPEARAVVFRRRRAIDWGRFLERYGIPPVDVVMAPNTTNAQRDDYLESAEAARDGRPAAWPAGSQISRAEGSRGQDPFSAFIDHQEKLVVLMSTGGTLTSLAQADTGALAGGAQMDVWTQIVARDGVAISAALNRDLFAPFLREAFPGRTVSARLELGREDAPSAAEAAELAVKLRGAGYRVDQSQLEEATGYKLEREEPAPQQPGFGGMAFNRRQPSAAPAKPRRAKTPTEEDAQVDKLAAAFQKDMRPVGKELRKLLETPEGDLKAACNALAKRLPKMIPASPSMADALEKEMAQAVADEVTQSRGEAEGKAVANARGGNPNNRGQFSETEGPHGESEKGKKRRELREKQDADIKVGTANMAALKSGKDCPDFMPGVRNSNVNVDHIGFYQGNNAQGYLHILHHGPDDSGVYNHQPMLDGDKIPRTIAKGTWYKHGDKIVAVDGNRCVVMIPDGNRLRVHTAYESKTRVDQILHGGYKRIYNRETLEDAQ